MQEEKIYDENLKSYSLYELYELLTPVLDKMYNNYKNIIEEPKLRKMALEVIKMSVMNFDINKGISFKEYFEKNMSNYFNTYIHNVNSNKDRKINLINHYIDNNINIANSYDSSLIEIKKLCAFFTEIEYKLKFDILEKIVNNEKINKLLKIIVEENLDLIEEDNINLIFDDKVFVLFIDTYCTINKIYRYDIDIDDDNFDLTLTDDNLKIYMHDISKIPLLTKKQEEELFNRYRNGDESVKEKIINSNLKLVVNIAKKLKQKYYYNINTNFLDLIQDGNIGLMKAVDKFDISKGYRFSTCAVYWIAQAIHYSIKKNSRIISVPRNIYSEKNKIETAKSTLQLRLSKSPTIDEISEETNIPVSTIELINNAMEDVVSLNESINDEGDDELEHFIPSNEESVESKADKNLLKEDIIKYIDTSELNDKAKDIIKRLYGINCAKETLESIGKRYGLTRQGIEQIEKRALKKLKKSNSVQQLKVYLDTPVENVELKNEPKQHRTTTLLKEIIENIDNDKLSVIEQNILKRVYGIELNKQSFAEIGEDFNLPEQQIKKIHDEALYKLGLSQFISSKINTNYTETNLIIDKDEKEIDGYKDVENSKSHKVYIKL